MINYIINDNKIFRYLLISNYFSITFFRVPLYFSYDLIKKSIWNTVLNNVELPILLVTTNELTNITAETVINYLEIITSAYLINTLINMCVTIMSNDHYLCTYGLHYII